MPAFCQGYTQEAIQNRHPVAYPISRLQRDWIYQDHGLQYGDCFAAAEDNKVEQSMVRKVLAELKARNVAVDGLQKSLHFSWTATSPATIPLGRACISRRVKCAASSV